MAVCQCRGAVARPPLPAEGTDRRRSASLAAALPPRRQSGGTDVGCGGFEAERQSGCRVWRKALPRERARSPDVVGQHAWRTPCADILRAGACGAFAGMCAMQLIQVLGGLEFIV